MRAAKALLAASIVATSISAAGGAASASTTSGAVVPCSSPSTSDYFAPWGDYNQYFLAPGANFQWGSSYQWQLSGGASLGWGGDPWGVSPASVYIPAGGQATSMTFCVNSTQPGIRFFYKSPGNGGAALFVVMETSNSTGTAYNTIDLGGGYNGWVAANIMMFPGLWGASGQENVTVSFSTANAPANWQVAGVMVDPFASR